MCKESPVCYGKCKDKQDTHSSIFKKQESSLVGDKDISINSNTR